MFQDINVAKSAPFALLTICQKSLYPPKKISKVPPFLQITQNLPTILYLDHEKWKPQISQQMRNSPTILYLDHEKWKPQISQQIARNSLNSRMTMANDAKSA